VFELISDNPALAFERSEYQPPIRVHHHAKHYIVYTIEPDRVLVLRVLREEVNLVQHLDTDA